MNRADNGPHGQPSLSGCTFRARTHSHGDRFANVPIDHRSEAHRMTRTKSKLSCFSQVGSKMHGDRWPVRKCHLFQRRCGRLFPSVRRTMHWIPLTTVKLAIATDRGARPRIHENEPETRCKNGRRRRRALWMLLARRALTLP